MKKLWKKLRLWYRPMPKRYERLLNLLIEKKYENSGMFLCILVSELNDDILKEDLHYRLKNMERMYSNDYKNTILYYTNSSFEKGDAVWTITDFTNRYSFLLNVIKDLS